MKIKKINESVEEYFDMEFIHECFIDFEESNFDVWLIAKEVYQMVYINWS